MLGEGRMGCRSGCSAVDRGGAVEMGRRYRRCLRVCSI